MSISGWFIYLACSVPIIFIFLFIHRNISQKRKVSFAILLYVVTIFTEGFFIELGLINSTMSLVAVGVFASLLYSVTLALVIRSENAELPSGKTSSRASATQDLSPDQITDIEPSTPNRKKGLDPVYKVAIIQGLFTIIAALIAKLL